MLEIDWRALTMLVFVDGRPWNDAGPISFGPHALLPPDEQVRMVASYICIFTYIYIHGWFTVGF